MTSRSIAIVTVVLIVAGCAAGVLVPAGIGWDFANFYDAGRRMAAGQSADLYRADSFIAGEPPQAGMRFWGAPLSAAFYSPLSLFRPETALILFKLENVAVLGVALVLLYQYCRRFAGTDQDRQAAFAAA